jgi:hypothetical protein
MSEPREALHQYVSDAVPFRVVSDFSPSGDQPAAIDGIVAAFDMGPTGMGGGWFQTAPPLSGLRGEGRCAHTATQGSHHRDRLSR